MYVRKVFSGIIHAWLEYLCTRIQYSDWIEQLCSDSAGGWVKYCTCPHCSGEGILFFSPFLFRLGALQLAGLLMWWIERNMPISMPGPHDHSTLTEEWWTQPSEAACLSPNRTVSKPHVSPLVVLDGRWLFCVSYWSELKFATSPHGLFPRGRSCL